MLLLLLFLYVHVEERVRASCIIRNISIYAKGYGGASSSSYRENNHILLSSFDCLHYFSVLSLYGIICALISWSQLHQIQNVTSLTNCNKNMVIVSVRLVKFKIFTLAQDYNLWDLWYLLGFYYGMKLEICFICETCAHFKFPAIGSSAWTGPFYHSQVHV